MRGEIHPLKSDGQELADIRLVIDDQYSRLRHAAIVASAARLRYPSQRCGSLNTIRKTLPPPLRGS